MAHIQASKDSSTSSINEQSYSKNLEIRSSQEISQKMAQPFTYGLDNPETLKKWNGPEYVVTPEQKRPGKKPARPDEVLSPHELDKRNRRRERNKLAQQKVRKKMNEQTAELRRQAVNLEIENANLESDIEILIRQRDQIVATFIRHTWVQEILKKSEELALKAVQGKLKQEDLDEIDDEKSPLDGESSSSSFTVKTEKA